MDTTTLLHARHLMARLPLGCLSLSLHHKTMHHHYAVKLFLQEDAQPVMLCLSIIAQPFQRLEKRWVSAMAAAPAGNSIAAERASNVTI